MIIIIKINILLEVVTYTTSYMKRLTSQEESSTTP